MIIDTKHILIVEDDLHLASSLRFILKMKKYLVTVSRTGKEAADCVEDCDREGFPLDLIVTDIQMPSMNGIEFMKFLSTKGSTVPVLAMTGFAESRMKEDLERLGCRHMLIKPFTQEAFLEKVELLLAGSANGSSGGA